VQGSFPWDQTWSELFSGQTHASTRQRRYGEDNSPLSAWLRRLGTGENTPLSARQHKISITDIDVYLSRRIGEKEHWMLIEFKSRGAKLLRFQELMLKQLDQIFTYALRYGFMASVYRGIHLVQASGAAIETSQLWLDGHPVSQKDLILFCRFEQPADWYIRRPWLAKHRDLPA